MLVSIITPTTQDREPHLSRLREYVRRQTYTNIEHIIVYEDGSIASKRNIACQQAKGEIIMHADSDDYIHPEWVERTVKHMIATGADTTGLDTAYFYQPHSRLWQFKWNGRQSYCIGGTLAYKRSIWEQNPFRDTKDGCGEDTLFMGKAGRIIPHKFIEGFVAMIHGNNTTSHIGVQTNPRFHNLHPSLMVAVLGKDYWKYPVV